MIFEFLLALQVVFTFWSQVGGQYHLDLMFWPWKFGLSLLAATLIVAITVQLTRAEGPSRRRVIALCSLLIATILMASAVTFYYHVNEPTDEDQDGIDQPARVSNL